MIKAVFEFAAMAMATAVAKDVAMGLVCFSACCCDDQSAATAGKSTYSDRQSMKIACFCCFQG